MLSSRQAQAKASRLLCILNYIPHRDPPPKEKRAIIIIITTIIITYNSRYSLVVADLRNY